MVSARCAHKCTTVSSPNSAQRFPPDDSSIPVQVGAQRTPFMPKLCSERDRLTEVPIIRKRRRRPLRAPLCPPPLSARSSARCWAKQRPSVCCCACVRSTMRTGRLRSRVLLAASVGGELKPALSLPGVPPLGLCRSQSGRSGCVDYLRYWRIKVGKVLTSMGLVV